MTSEDYPYLTQLSVPDRLRLAAYEARERGLPAIDLSAILDAAEELEMLIRWEGQNGVQPAAPYPIAPSPPEPHIRPHGFLT